MVWAQSMFSLNLSGASPYTKLHTNREGRNALWSPRLTRGCTPNSRAAVAQKGIEEREGKCSRLKEFEKKPAVQEEDREEESKAERATKFLSQGDAHGSGQGKITRTTSNFMMLSVELYNYGLCDWKGHIACRSVYTIFPYSPPKLVAWIMVKRLSVAIKTLEAACYALPQIKILGLIDGIVVSLMITWFAANFFEVKNVKEIEPALRKSSMIFTAAMEVIINIMALLSSFTIFEFGTQKDIKSCQWSLHTVVGLLGGRTGGVHCSLFIFLLIEEGHDALGLEQNKLSSSFSLERKDREEHPRAERTIDYILNLRGLTMYTAYIPNKELNYGPYITDSVSLLRMLDTFLHNKVIQDVAGVMFVKLRGCFLLQSGSSLSSWLGNQIIFEPQQAKASEFLPLVVKHIKEGIESSAIWVAVGGI